MIVLILMGLYHTVDGLRTLLLAQLVQHFDICRPNHQHHHDHHHDGHHERCDALRFSELRPHVALVAVMLAGSARRAPFAKLSKPQSGARARTQLPPEATPARAEDDAATKSRTHLRGAAVFPRQFQALAGAV